MPKFRKKPVTIEALHYDERIAKQGWGWPVIDAHPWLDEAYDNDVIANIRGVDGNYLRIKTLEGEMRCSPGDWLIRGVKGELYPCKPDIFAATYDEVLERLGNPTIADLEKILSEPSGDVTINPDGTVTATVSR